MRNIMFRVPTLEVFSLKPINNFENIQTDSVWWFISVEQGKIHIVGFSLASILLGGIVFIVALTLIFLSIQICVCIVYICVCV